MVDPVEMLKTREGAALVALDAYRRCNGDPNTMTDFLMETVMSGAVRHLEGSPPLKIDGHAFDAVDALREIVRLGKVAAVIEAQDQAQH